MAKPSMLLYRFLRPKANSYPSYHLCICIHGDIRTQWGVGGPGYRYHRYFMLKQKLVIRPSRQSSFPNAEKQPSQASEVNNTHLKSKRIQIEKTHLDATG